MLEWVKDKHLVDFGFGYKLLLVENLVSPNRVIFINCAKQIQPVLIENFNALAVVKNIPIECVPLTESVEEVLKSVEESPNACFILFKDTCEVHPEILGRAIHISFEYVSTTKAKQSLNTVITKEEKPIDEFDSLVTLRVTDNRPFLLNGRLDSIKIPKNWFFGFIYSIHEKLPKDILHTYDNLGEQNNKARLYLVLLQFLYDLIYMKLSRIPNSYVPNKYLDVLNIERLYEMIAETNYIIDNELYIDIQDSGNLYCMGIKTETIDISEGVF